MVKLNRRERAVVETLKSRESISAGFMGADGAVCHGSEGAVSFAWKDVVSATRKGALVKSSDGSYQLA